jgi:predicted ATPase
VEVCEQNRTNKNTRLRLPNLLTEPIGRLDFIQKIATQMATRRSVTIVGTGGVGKTTVALAVAHQVAEDYRDGAVVVDLTSILDSKLVLSTLCAELRITSGPENLMFSLLNFLNDKKILIILDGCEHVITETAKIVELVLRCVPNVHFLTTSREPLRIEGERLQRLPSLECPPIGVKELSISEVIRYPAVQLFVERAAANLESFHLTDEEAPALATICQKLDGIPLAIELAAARVDLFGVAGLSVQIEQGLSFLSRSRRTAHARHSSLRANLDWSFNLLSDKEQLILLRLSIFEHSFSSDEAIVAVDEELDDKSILEGLANLASSSFIVTNFTNDKTSYRLLETIRRYAKEKLDDHILQTSRAKLLPSSRVGI